MGRFSILFATALMVGGIQTATAQGNQVSASAMTHMTQIARTCPGGWDQPACLRSVAESNYVMISNYGAHLQERRMDQAAEMLKNHCAASTAARTESVPAYAMASAMTECSNMIATLSEQTGITPDLSHYQLMIAPTLCLSGKPECASITEQIENYAR